MKKSLFTSLMLGILISEPLTAQTGADNPFGNALIPDMIADASIQEINGTFYCYATTDGYGRGLETSGPPVVWKSKDFVHWSFDGTYFPSAAKEKYWAPSKAVAANGKYYIYPTINGYMYPAVADSPDGPFRLARGKDEFHKPFTTSTLLQTEDPGGIDAEVFIDDDGQAYVFWGRRHVAKLNKDMITVNSDIQMISTPRKEYSEGPIFFKRQGIYYYLYTIGGDEKYQYAYVMSKVSPMGPFEFPKQDIISTTDYKKGVFGPGHGCVFSPEGTDDYYFAYLEFGRRSTNRQTYVNRLEFNEDGTIRPVELTLDGVGALPAFAADGANGSRWMAADRDNESWIVADLGTTRKVRRSEVYFVRPTAGHAYLLEGSNDGKVWEACGGHEDIRIQSPHTDAPGKKYRYLRIKISEGVKGIWEWNIY